MCIYIHIYINNYTRYDTAHHYSYCISKYIHTLHTIILTVVASIYILATLTVPEYLVILDKKTSICRYS